VTLFALVGLALAVPFAARSHGSGGERMLHTLQIGRSMQGEPGSVGRGHRGVVDPTHRPPSKRITPSAELHLTKAHSAVFDVRNLRSTVTKRERPERPAPGEAAAETGAEPEATSASPTETFAAQLGRRSMTKSSAGAAAAPPPDASFDGLDFANWGDGHPPDTNGDVGPAYYIQTINTAIGIYDKSNGSRVAAFTFDAFMSQGQFGNLCDTDNFGDPVVLYDSFEDRWVITDFAFKLDGSGNVSPQHVFECFAVSKTGDPVAGGWNFYSIETPGGLGDYPKLGVWPDGIYMSANMFGYGATASFVEPRVWAINKEQMYAGEPTAQVADFAAPSDDFTLLPANARLQAGSPPTGSPEYFVSTWKFLNAVLVYKLHVDWDKISTSTFTGPDSQLAPNCWPNADVSNIPTPANSLDSLEIRAMAQAQYANVGGAESVWVSHTVQRGVSATSTNCNAPTGGNATVRWYQLNVTGGTVASTVAQGGSFDPDAANTFFRWMPSLAVDRLGDMAIGYSKANAATNPQIKYAGRLAGDPANILGQTEQTLIAGTGSQSGNCGASACSRWGDYSGMSLDPNGCSFWETNEYYAVTGLDHHTRIGSFRFPGCTNVGNGMLSGTVSDGSNPLAGATVTLGARTATTNASGNYSFPSLPAGTYPSLSAGKAGFDSAASSTVAVPDGGTATRNFTLTAAAQSGCFTDNTQPGFQRGTPTNCDLVASPGSVVLAKPDNTQAQNSTVSSTGFGITNTTWAGQTFTPAVTGQLLRVDVELFCASCTAAGPSITLSIRATTGATPVPTGPDLATASITGFNDGGAGGLHTFALASPITLTAGTRYAFIFRNSAAFANGTVAYTCSCAAPGANPYASGQRVTSNNSGSTWAADTTAGGRDLNFVTYVNPGYSNGTFVSSLKDANPAAGNTARWTTLTFSATKPAGTDVKFQVAASDSSSGPFSFVGPDGTPSTYFTTSGADLSQFNGFRYLRYKAILSTTDGSVTPSLSGVAVCFSDTTPGTLTASTTAVSAGQSGRSIVFTYTAPAGGMVNGALRIEVPSDWPTPTATVGQQGYTTTSMGSLSFVGNQIVVSGLNRTSGQKVTLTYGSKVGPSPGATAPSTPDVETWPAQSRLTGSGTFHDLSPSPVITVYAADGSGQVTSSPGVVSAASGGQTITLVYTAATGGLSNGVVRVAAPTGWTAPSTVVGTAGYTSASTGSVSASGQRITVSGVTLNPGDTLTIGYGDKTAGGPGSTASSTTGPQSWATDERSTQLGVNISLAVQPKVTVAAGDGSGTITPSPTFVPPGSSGKTVTFTYTAAKGGLSGGGLTLQLPSGWSSASQTGAAPGYTTASTGSVSASGGSISVTGINLVAAQKLTIVYGSRALGGPGATAPATASTDPWLTKERSTSVGSLTNLSSQPVVTVLSADGSGSMSPSTSSVTHSTHAAITFTYTAGTGGLNGGVVRLTVPSGWSAPSIDPAADGYSVSSKGALAVSSQRITVSGVTLAGGGTFTITYGAGSAGATAPVATAAQTWQTLEKSWSGGTMMPIATQPQITVN
jgi:hypothetical protein